MAAKSKRSAKAGADNFFRKLHTFVGTMGKRAIRRERSSESDVFGKLGKDGTKKQPKSTPLVQKGIKLTPYRGGGEINSLPTNWEGGRPITANSKGNK